MSVWTHVNGSVRIDSIRIMLGISVEEIKEAFGKMAHYDDPNEVWIECNVPCGSEGSLYYEIIENPDISQIAAFRIQIWGDLRDYDDVNEIEKWFRKALEEKFIVRSAILEIEVEYKNTRTILYYEGDGKIKRLDLTMAI